MAVDAAAAVGTVDAVRTFPSPLNFVAVSQTLRAYG